jgi:putative hemolysin
MEVLLITVLILINAFLSLSEIAVLTAQPHRLAARADAGDRGARAALGLRATPARFLATIQLGITLVGLLAGAVSGVTVGTRLGAFLERVPLIGPVGTEVGIVGTVLVVTYVWVVLGELVPKRVALSYPEPIAVGVSATMRTLDRLAAIPVRVLAISTNVVARIFGVRQAAEMAATADDITALASEGAEAGSIDPAQHALVERVFRLSERPASEIMTPRPDLSFLQLGDREAVVRAATSGRHSRYPVSRDVEDDVEDDVVGIVRTADLFAQFSNTGDVDVQSAMRPAVFVPEVSSIMQVLERMRQSGTHAILVIDEQGVVQGLITAHDILEAVVGELPAPGEGDYPELVPRRDGSWLADGALPVEELRTTLGAPGFPGDELRHCETVGGLVMASLGRVPLTGDRLTCAGITLEVVDMDGRRVDKVLVDRRASPHDPANR